MKNPCSAIISPFVFVGLGFLTWKHEYKVLTPLSVSKRKKKGKNQQESDTGGNRIGRYNILQAFCSKFGTAKVGVEMLWVSLVLRKRPIFRRVFVSRGALGDMKDTRWARREQKQHEHEFPFLIILSSEDPKSGPCWTPFPECGKKTKLEETVRVRGETG